ncbi:hypothetical protein H6P81_014649 [Aristolochia fimbriata]|uniref:Uncharacterized protein n=1 Tax=Aristolochia fimbriata TaxID=158543 RepID=A0AAV7E457_ARIFI|nr:hypothetical protein H6P81_014649 [Aristolochia fimbriata]
MTFPDPSLINEMNVSLSNLSLKKNPFCFSSTIRYYDVHANIGKTEGAVFARNSRKARRKQFQTAEKKEGRSKIRFESAERGDIITLPKEVHPSADPLVQTQPVNWGTIDWVASIRPPPHRGVVSTPPLHFDSPTCRCKHKLEAALLLSPEHMKFLDWYLKIGGVSALIGASMEYFMIRTGFCMRK